MPVNTYSYQEISKELKNKKVKLIAVSKTKPKEDIEELYAMGQRDFGENYVQELADKQALLPTDIHWHFIGHLQTNKVKYIAPYVYLIHGVDSFKLLQEINKQAIKHNRVIDCLLQMHIAQEETKFGLDETELKDIMQHLKDLNHIRIIGLMGMASNSEDSQKIKKEFLQLHDYFIKYNPGGSSSTAWSILSMGMSGDYQLAIQCGSNMVRIGSLIFGERNYLK